MSYSPPVDLRRDFLSDRWTSPTELVGEVPLAEALAELRRAELVTDWPPGRDPATVVLPESSRLIDLRDAIERQMSWVLYRGRFLRFAGNLQVAELNRTIGRPRVQVRISIRFVRVSGSLGLDDVSAGVTTFQYHGWWPEGETRRFANNQERSYTRGVTGLQGEGGAVVETDRQTVSSGVDFEGSVSLMPGGFARVDGNLNVSAFVGRDLDRNTTDVPLSIDLARDSWQPVHFFTGLDAAAAYGFHGEGLSANLGGDRIRVDVRVD